MREIKFRYWSDKGKRFWYFDASDYESGDGFFKWGKDFQQYTGLKDKNGKEIYEGDIFQGMFERHVIMFVTDRHNCGFAYEVISKEDSVNNETFYAPFKQSTIDYYQLKVLGNIYENKELLK